MLDLKEIQVAQSCDVSTRTISRLKNSEVTALPVTFLYNIHVKYNVNLNWLIAGNGDIFGVNSEKNVAAEPVANYEKREENRYARHLEEENRWLREKYDELMKQLGHIRGNNPGNMRDSG